MQQMMQYIQPTSGRRGSGVSLETLGMSDFEQTKHPYLEGNLKYIGAKDDNPIQCDLPVMCLKFSPDGTIFAVGLSDGAIRIYSSDTMQYRYSLMDEDTTSRHLPVTSIHFLNTDEIQAENRLMATYASGLIKFWHYTSGTSLSKIDEVRQTLSCAWNPVASAFITCGADPQIIKYDAETKKQIRIMEPSDSRDVMNGHRARVFAVQYHAHFPNTFISGGWDDTVQFWDDREQHSKRKISGPHICGDALDIDPTHNHILTGSWRKENTLQIWDFNTGEKIKDVPQDSLHGSRLYCAQWLGKEHIMCGGCEQNTARIIDRGTLNTVGQLTDLPQGVYCMDHHGGRTSKVLVSSGTKIHVLKLEKRQ